MFAAGMMALAVLCILYKDFIVGRPPAWPAQWNPNPALGYIAGLLLIVAAVAVFINRFMLQAGLLMALLIFLFSLLRHFTTFADTWLNGFKTMALLGGCLIVAASGKDGSTVFQQRNGRLLLQSGIVLIAAFLLVCGYAHFKYAPFVDALIPAYIPFHSFWTYCCGVCLFAGGAGLLVPPTRRLASLLSAIMIAGWFLLLHIPRFLADPSNTSDTLGVCESFAFAGILFCAAGLLTKTGNRFSAIVDEHAYLGEIGIK